MGKDKHSVELSSRTVKAGHRVYFVDAKVDSQGNCFVAISEVKSSIKDGDTQRERQRIHIYEEDIPKFLDAMGDALTAIAETKKEQSTTITEGSDASGGVISVGATPASVEIPNLNDIIDL